MTLKTVFLLVQRRLLYVTKKNYIAITSSLLELSQQILIVNALLFDYTYRNRSINFYCSAVYDGNIENVHNPMRVFVHSFIQLK